MSTAAHYERPNTPPLPAPKVMLYKPLPAPLLRICDQSILAGNLVDVTTKRHVKISCPGIPQEIFDNLPLYEPLLELMRYTGGGTVGLTPSQGGNGSEGSAYVHPSNIIPSGNGSFTHGGLQSVSGVGPALAALRQTEWPVTLPVESFDVTQGLLSFMVLGIVPYRNAVTSLGAGTLGIYSASAALRRRKFVQSKRFPYGNIYSPGYFQFRLSIKDPRDERGKRIHGPSSIKISCSNSIFPFDPAPTVPFNVPIIGGAAQAFLNLNFISEEANFWLGSTSRLPAS